MRATMSAEPPGANGTMILMGRSGYLSAGDCARPPGLRKIIAATPSTTAASRRRTAPEKCLLTCSSPRLLRAVCSRFRSYRCIGGVDSRRHGRVVLGGHHLQAPHVTRLVRTIVGDGIVYRTDVVPHQHVAFGPFMSVEELVLLLMREKERQQFDALGFSHVVDTNGVAGIAVEHGAPGDRMRAEDRLRNRRPFGALLGCQGRAL